MRKIMEVNGNIVRHNREWDEYVVTFRDGTTYHTDDRQDAIDTAKRG